MNMYAISAVEMKNYKKKIKKMDQITNKSLASELMYYSNF